MRGQSNKRSRTRLKTESETHTPYGRVRLARFAHVRLLRHALQISLLILRKKPTVLQSTIDLTFLILVWEVIWITAGVLGSRSHTRNHYTMHVNAPDKFNVYQEAPVCTEWWYLTCKSYRKCNETIIHISLILSLFSFCRCILLLL